MLYTFHWVRNRKSVCPWIRFNTASPVSASQTQIELSQEPETMRLSSGENTTVVTVSLCPLRGFNTGLQVSASQTRIVQSQESEAMCLPLGQKWGDSGILGVASIRLHPFQYSRCESCSHRSQIRCTFYQVKRQQKRH
jgi:hypothetical protein